MNVYNSDIYLAPRSLKGSMSSGGDVDSMVVKEQRFGGIRLMMIGLFTPQKFYGLRIDNQRNNDDHV